MFYRLQCWVRRVIFRRQYPSLSRRTLEECFATLDRRSVEERARIAGLQQNLDIAVRNGNWRHDHPLAIHFHLNPELARVMRSRFHKQINDEVSTKAIADEARKRVIDLIPLELPLSQE